MGNESDISILDCESADSSYDPLVGAQVGEYRVSEKIGSGAMCNVYRARHIHEGTDVAIKILEVSPSTRRSHVQRMRREAAVSARVDHPNIVKVFEFARIPGQCAYLVMELVRGRSLHELLNSEGPISSERAARILRETAAGLVAAHSAGYVHRDLKPGNLMIHEGQGIEHVKILDFGIVGTTADRALDTQLTEEHSILGTPSYMAPEQLESPFVGQAADLYALGGILYHMLAGRPPFSGSFREIVAQQMVAAPDPLPYAEGLGPLAHWLLEKAPAQRPESAAQVVQLLDTIILEIERKKTCGPLEPTTASQVLMERSSSGWFGPLSRAASKLSKWPLRITVPVVSLVAIAGGAFAARQILGAGVEPPAMVAEAAAGAPARVAMHAGKVTPQKSQLDLTTGLLQVPAGEPEQREAQEPRERTIEAIDPSELEPGAPKVQSLQQPEIKTHARADKRPLLVRGDDLFGEREADTYTRRLSQHELTLLRARLQRISDAIKSNHGVIPSRELASFEHRYKALSSMVRPELGELGRDGLVRHLETLSAQLASTQRRYAP